VNLPCFCLYDSPWWILNYGPWYRNGHPIKVSLTMVWIAWQHTNKADGHQEGALIPSSRNYLKACKHVLWFRWSFRQMRRTWVSSKSWSKTIVFLETCFFWHHYDTHTIIYMVCALQLMTWTRFQMSINYIRFCATTQTVKLENTPTRKKGFNP
jgi:hypothetical protein